MDMEPALTNGIIFSDLVVKEEGTGKLSLIGAFQNFNASSFPFHSSPFYVTAMVTNLRGKLDKLPVCIRICDKATALTVCNGVIEISSGTPVTPDQVFDLPLRLGPVVFPKAGVYLVEVLIGTETTGKRELPVLAISAATSAAI